MVQPVVRVQVLRLEQLPVLVSFQVLLVTFQAGRPELMLRLSQAP
jgi:hypothetical protein